ncbi:hypothetical protein FRC09_006983 [Ceratobasidium sp. 395]|nr:hypothetical protein FRC09_006983 [Ceratobasidium sp. 395]
MRFFYTALVASFAVAVSGIAIDVSKLTLADVENVEEILIEEQCRGAVKWSEEGFFRSGSTVRYHNHLWQCTHWNRGENPENSKVWRDLGECDPDLHKTLGKRSTANIQALDDDDDDTVCDGAVDWEEHATYRSGTTVHYGDHLWQTLKWNKGDKPGVSPVWIIVATCPSGLKLAKRDECAGLRKFDGGALYRSGTTVEYDDKKYQAQRWVKGENPSNTKFWKYIEDC